MSIQSSKKRPLRVAFFSCQSSPFGSGNERLIQNTAHALIARGYDIRHYVMDTHIDGMLPFFIQKIPTLPGEQIIERAIAILTGWNDFMFPSTALLRFHPWIGNADIWHFHNLHARYVSIPLLGLMSWTKRIVVSPVDQYLSTGYCTYTLGCERYLTGCGSCPRVDDPYPKISRDSTHALWQMKRLFSCFSKVNMLFHTKSLANHYAKTFVKNRPSEIIYYGEDINCYRPLPREDCARRLGIEPSLRFTVGLFHSFILDPRKGILPIIEKLGEVGKKFPGKIELLIVGHGSKAVKNIFPSELKVTVLPYLNHAHDLSNALNLCDVLLYPTQGENMSLLTLSAIACGVPVISYDAGGQIEVIKNKVNGFIVEINDFEGMFMALLEMLQNRDLCRRLSEGARRTAEEDFDFDRYIDDLIIYYNKII